jgi:hypothetical protein
MVILRICQAADKFPEKRKTKRYGMSDRFKQPNKKRKLPKSDGAKCALAYSLLVKDIESKGVPFEVADIMATEVVLSVLEETKVMRQESKLRYDIYSTVFNN